MAKHWLHKVTLQISQVTADLIRWMQISYTSLQIYYITADLLRHCRSITSLQIYYITAEPIRWMQISYTSLQIYYVTADLLLRYRSSTSDLLRHSSYLLRDCRSPTSLKISYRLKVSIASFYLESSGRNCIRILYTGFKWRLWDYRNVGRLTLK